jgi:HK97 family phage major capsid protein
VSAEPETQLFPHEYVQKLRSEAAGYRTELNEARAALNFYINKYPLGDLDNFSVSRAAYAHAHEKLYKSRRVWDQLATYEKAYYERKAMGEQISGLDGGFLAPEIWGGPYFALLRSFSVLDQLPVTKVKVPAHIRHLPKITGDVTATYPQEGASVTTSNFQVGQISYTARKAEHLLTVSNELIRDAPGVADTILRQESAMAHALDRDTQLLLGQGGMNPTGLIPLSTNGTIKKWYPGASATASITGTAAHGTPSFLHVSQLRGAIHSLNSAVGGGTGFTNYTGQAHCNGVIAHSRFEQTVFTQAAAAGPWTDAQGRPLWMGGMGSARDMKPDPVAQGGGAPSSSGSINGLMGQNWALTNILPVNSSDGGGTTSSFMIGGWWDMYVLFENAEFLYDAAIEPAFGTDQTLIRAVHRYDGGPARPEAFAVLAGCDA